MSELETRLREALVEAVPGDLAAAGLAEGARRYAVRTRRVRMASAAVVAAAAVVVAAVVSSGMFSDRAVAPAKPGPIRVQGCDDQVEPTPLRSAPTEPASARYQSVLVCALRGSDSAWPGALPPDGWIDTPEAIDSLAWELKTQGGDCASLPVGQAFTVTVQGHDGRVATYLNTDLRCSGWSFLDGYYIALSEEHSEALSTADGFPRCTSLLGEDSRGAGNDVATLAKGTVLTEAAICMHPKPGSLSTVPKPRWVARGVLGDIGLAKLNAELAAHGSVNGRPLGRCAGTPADRVWVLHARTSKGGSIYLRTSEGCATTFTVNRSQNESWQVSRTTFDALSMTGGPLPW